MRQQILVDGVWVEGVPALNEWYKQEITLDVWQEQRNVAVIEPNPIYKTANESVTINGNDPESLSPVCFASKGSALSIAVDIVDADGMVQMQIDQTALGYPPVLGLPLQKTKGVNGDIESELYLTTTIADGHITATLSADELTIGNWELTEERVNGSLAEIGADWKISMNTISIRVL